MVHLFCGALQKAPTPTDKQGVPCRAKRRAKICHCAGNEETTPLITESEAILYRSVLALCSQTCEHCRGIRALILPNKVAHVAGGVTGSEQAPHVDRVKLGNNHNAGSDTIYVSFYHFVRTLSSWAWVTLSVRPPIRSSPPYTLSPGTSFTRASFPRAWSLRDPSVIHLAEMYHWCSDFVLFFKKSHQWWCVVRIAVKDKPSLFTISSSCTKKKRCSKLQKDILEMHNIITSRMRLIQGCKMDISYPSIHLFILKTTWKSHPMWNSGVHSDSLLALLFNHQVHVVVLQDGDHLHLHDTFCCLCSTGCLWLANI